MVRLLKGEFTSGSAEDNLNNLKSKLRAGAPTKIKNICYIKQIQLHGKDVRQSQSSLQIKQTKFYRLIVMEYYPWSLADLLSYYSHLRYTKSHLNFIVYAFTGILKAVMQLHELGYVHRDLKLDNFMLDQNFNIYLNDFQLVTKELVIDSSLSGTLQYMAPERLSNKRLTSPITKKVDIWSLGIILYQLFTGQTPYIGQNQDQILEDIYQKYIKVKQIPSEAMSLISQLLQIRSEKRPQLQQIFNSSFLQKEIDLDLIRGIIPQ